MSVFRLILFPFSIIYGLIIFFRNLFYDSGLLTSEKFDIPIISVGNILVGGTGKTPMVEYLVRLLRDKYKVGVVSRGYKRRSSGFVEALETSTVEEVGDEPLQYKLKFKEITVAVSEQRIEGVNKIKDKTEVILLDDAYQHRRISAGIQILLWDYQRIFEPDFLLPAGNLREFKSEMERAQIIIVTKTPKIFSPMEKRRVENKLKPKPHQTVVYAYTEYGDLTPLNEGQVPMKMKDLKKKTKVLLITGIARAELLVNYLESFTKNFEHLEYPDHYKFSLKDVNLFKHKFENFEETDKIIITTEKDACRLMLPKLKGECADLPLYYLPIQSELHKEDKELFDQLILEYVGANQPNIGIH